VCRNDDEKGRAVNATTLVVGKEIRTPHAWKKRKWWIVVAGAQKLDERSVTNHSEVTRGFPEAQGLSMLCIG
jgi:hypothetical protein